MRIPLFLPLLLTLALSLPLTFASSSVFVFNSTAECVSVGECRWEDGSTWNGGVIPSCAGSDQCSVTASSPAPVTLLIEGYTVVNMSISLTGNINLVVDQNSTLQIPSLSWDSTSSVAILNSIVVLSGMVNSTGSLNITGSFMQGPFVKVTNLQILDSTFDIIFFGVIANATVSQSNLRVNYTDVNTNASLIIESSNATLGWVAGLQSYTPANQLEIFDSSVSFYGTVLSLVTGGSSEINVIGGRTEISAYSQQGSEPVATVFNVFSGLTITNISRLDGSINLYGGSYVDLANNASIIPPADLPCISGNGSLYVSTLVCHGVIDVDEVDSFNNISVETLKVTNMDLHGLDSTAYIYGDVEVTHYSAYSTKLIVHGDYTQEDGSIDISFFTQADTPAFKVSGEVEMMHVDVGVRLLWPREQFKRLALVEAEDIKFTFDSISDPSLLSRVIYAYAKEGTLYVGDKPPSWRAQNWIYIIFFTVVGVIALLVLGLLVCGATSKRNYVPDADPHEYFSDVIASFRGPSKKRSCGTWFCFIFLLIIAIPFITEFVTFSVALGALIPLGFFFGLIEHKFVFGWALISFLIQVGGLLDLVADVILLAKVFVFYVEDEFEVHQAGESLEEESRQETAIFGVRVGLTIVGSLVSLITCLIFFGNITSFKPKKAPAKSVAKNSTTTSGPKPTSPTAINHTSTTTTNTTTTNTAATINTTKTAAKPSAKPAAKKAPAKKKEPGSCYLPNIVLIPLILFSLAMWKVVLIGIRLYLVFIVFAGLIRHRRLLDTVQRKVQWLEWFLYLDLMFSGIPLGILTMLQLFLYEKDEEFGGDQVFELMKLSALAVDLVGASFLFYYIFVGLIHKIPALSHHDHHGHHDHHDAHGAHGAHGGGAHGAHEVEENGENGVAEIGTEKSPLLAHV